MSFLTELKRRNVVRVGIAYVVGAWLLLQFTDVLSELLNLPESIGPIAVACVAIGLPITLILAWIYELTPQGVKREAEVDRNQSITPSTGKKLNAAIVLMLSVAVVYLLYDKFYSRAPDAASEPPTQTEQAVSQPEADPIEDLAPIISRQSIAVLPFKNRSRLEDDEYFVEGIHDDLLTKLAKIGSLKVISRTSVERIEDTDLSMQEIAQKLGVATIMEGAVQRAGNQVRINVQLINADTDEHLWAEIYDREMTTENLFAIQTEISEAIAHALKAELTAEEKQRISDRPTQNLEAYTAYLRGMQILKSRDSELHSEAMDFFRLAIELDPNFAEAWVGLAGAATFSQRYGSMSFEESVAIYRDSAERALDINPLLGEAWAIKASILVGLDQQYNEGEEAFLRALELSPNNALVHNGYSHLLMRIPGRSDEFIKHNQLAIELDPLWDAPLISRAGFEYLRRNFSAANRAYIDLLTLDPDSAALNLDYASLLSSNLNNLDEAITVARRAVKLGPGSPRALSTLARIYLLLGDLEAFQRTRGDLEERFPDHDSAGLLDWNQQVLSGEFKQAVESISWVADKTNRPGPIVFEIGETHAANGNLDRARDLMLEAFPQLLTPEEWGDWFDANYTLGCKAGWVLQRSGHEQLGTDLIAASLDHVETTIYPNMVDKHLVELDVCLAAAGETERAIDALEQRLDHGHLDYLNFRLQPTYSSIKDDPRFHAAWERLDERLNKLREKLVSEGIL